ncbi:MAG: CARDB domain-containing protein [candidate division WOR-3 bacterium]
MGQRPLINRIVIAFDSATWAAHGRGNYTVVCSTMLANDMNRNNDRATSSIFVHVHNVGATAIIAPTGTIDSASTTVVRARVRNFGNQTESFQVRFSISGPANWTATATVNNLAAGESTVVNFADWPVGPRGSYSAACSTMLAVDLVRGNDKITAPFSVRVRDVEARAVISPPAAVDSAATVAVRVVTANNGTGSENIKTIVTIGSVYRDSATRSVAPGGVDTFSLSSWQVRLARGSYPVVCSTWIAGDMRPGNNVVRTATLVRVNDVACVGIVAPTGSVDSGTVLAPQARVSNPGSVAQTFGVRFTISPGGYLSEQTITLAAGAETLVTFAPWTAAPVGPLVTRCSTMLGNDANPVNNVRSGTVTVTGTDVAVTAVVAPTGEVEPGQIVPVCHIESYAPQPVSFWTSCRIADSLGRLVYRDSALVQNLLPDSGRDVSFAPWNAVAGRYTVRCSVGLGDRVPQNDTISASCLVVTHDVALLAIVSPASVIRPNAVVPLLRVTNYGTTSDLFPVEMVITDSVSGRIVYRDSATVNWILPGERRDVRLRTWNAEAGYYRCEAWTRLATDVNRSNDSGRVRVKVSWGEIGWQQRPDIPAGAASVKHGGGLARLAGSGLIYALKGNKTGEFYSYNPRTSTWATLAQVPAGPSGRPVNKGGDLTTDDTRFVYVLKGNRTLEFWRYDTRNSSWEQMADLPAGSTPPKVGSALACVTRGDSVLVFCLKASGTFEFYMYDAGSNRWYTGADAPAGLLGKKFKAGSSLCAASSRHLYAVKSRENEFYRYDISANTWTEMARMPSYAQSGKRSSCRDGCDLAADGLGGVYAFSGGNREFFFYYDESRNEWAECTPIPPGPSGKKVKAGGSLTVLGRQCWALKGNRTFEFWVYTPDTMMVMAPRPVRAGISAEPQTAEAAGFAVWPRVTRGAIRVRYQPGSDPVPARLTVFSMLGGVALERTVRPGITQLDLSQLPSGAYFLRLDAPEAVVVEKLIRE